MSNILPPTILVMGPPGSGKSTLARQALREGGSGLVALAPGMDEATSYKEFMDNPAYAVKGFDDTAFFPMDGSLVANGYLDLLRWLRGVHATLVKEQQPGTPPRFKWLVTDTFSSMAMLAMNQTHAHLNREMPPAAMSPDGAAFWGYQKNLCEALARICRSIRGLGVGWIATCHVQEKEQKETSIADPERTEGVKKHGIVPAISGGYRDVVSGGFDLVLHAGVMRVKEKVDGKEVLVSKHFLQHQPSGKRPTKSRYGTLANGEKIAASWATLTAAMAKAEQP